MKLKKECGITLLALIITVILLVILATVTINAVFDSGIIWQASNGTQNYVSAEKTENSIIGNTASIMQEYIDGTYSGGSTSGSDSGDSSGGETGGTTQDTTAPSAGLTVTAYDTTSITVKATGEDAESEIKSYTFEISESDTFSNAITTTYTTDETSYVETFNNLTSGKTYYIRVTVTNNVDLTATATEEQATEEAGMSSTELASVIGSYVDYTPTSGSFTNSTTYSGYSSNQSFTTLSSLNWRILFVDNSTLTLISSNVANTEFYLYSYEGYNNGVKLLNDACEAMYSNSSLGATGRSLNVDDIQSVSSYKEISYSNYGTEYTPAGKYYPNIFALETTGYVNTAYGEDYTRSQQDKYITGYSTASTLKGIYTFFEYAMSEAYMDSVYYAMFTCQSGTSGSSSYTSYWLSSRYSAPYSDYNRIYYGVFSSAAGYVSGIHLCSSSDDHSWNKLALRPVVEINLSAVSVGLTGDGTSSSPYSITAK